MRRSAKAGVHQGRPPKYFIRSKSGKLYLRKKVIEFLSFYLPISLSYRGKNELEIIIHDHWPYKKKPTVADLRQITKSSLYYGYVKHGDQWFDSKDGHAAQQWTFDGVIALRTFNKLRDKVRPTEAEMKMYKKVMKRPIPK